MVRPDVNRSSFDWRRRSMVERLARMGIRREEVLAAMNSVPRHLFVEEALRSRAYDDMSLPLGLGQTISQPYTVAVMTQLMLGKLPVAGFGRVLEIGTGCGYQTAVLQAAGLAQVYSVERLRPLHEKAKHNLRQAGLIGRIRMVCGDGYLGLPEVAPFDGILVTAAPAEVPLPLLQQLAVGGRMVIPLDEGGHQYLWLIEKTERGFHETCIQEARFVPLINGT
ncbi:protein-L-isoaspartate(D-aspartate) O-methyltransferase [Neisseria shayeganii]|uniref:Protein-L-isoaspartate O-methyltransferase n=1 Tax=Neisseria shayeganii TaxID=607712 RepID=A0A7D7N7N4_9NEIS|nr:protein-L-isoaspartate(D-aspartate) O-methyltransferase [Neisseria shayeganii]QMT40561.1 protein-L-isoaspartate(D-aspartate) O-methyltransferase [Neisseria shayeganii]